MAERAGFEPAVPLSGTTAFEAAAFNRSATSPPIAGAMISDPHKALQCRGRAEPAKSGGRSGKMSSLCRCALWAVAGFRGERGICIAMI